MTTADKGITSRFTNSRRGTARRRTFNAKCSDLISVLDMTGFDNTGVSDNAAAFTALAAGDYIVPGGTYGFSSSANIGDSVNLFFQKDAKLVPLVDGVTIFKTTAHAYGTNFYTPTFDPNGKNGTVCFDMVNFRHASGIHYPTFLTVGGYQIDTGIYLRQLCWDTTIDSPFGQGVKNPIKITDGSNAVQIFKPGFDGAGLVSGTDAITVTNGGTYSTTSTFLQGGHLQGYRYGFRDTGTYGSVVIGTYFENNSIADIYMEGAIGFNLITTNHISNSGPRGIKGTSCNAGKISNPFMTSGARSTGLFDFDGTNVECYAEVITSGLGINLPLGIVTGLNFNPKENRASWVPAAVGTTSAGAMTGVSGQAGTIIRNGSILSIEGTVSYTSHSGTGNLKITGIPNTYNPASYTPTRIGQLILAAAYTGPVIYCYLNGTNMEIQCAQVSTAGVESFIPLPTGAATIKINMQIST